MQAVQLARPAPQSLLIVDDTQGYRILLEREYRRAQPGSAVFSLSDGQRAIEHLARCGPGGPPMPDLVLLDRDMPGGPDGYEVLRVARSLEKLTSLPILMVSGSDDPEHVAQASGAGASGYIVKPGQSDAYARLVREVLTWWQAKHEETMLRGFCANMGGVSLADYPSPVVSRSSMHASLPVPTAGSVSAETPLGQMSRLLGEFYGYLTGGGAPQVNGLFVDRKAVEITRACREEGIEEMHARGRSQDPVLVRKRGRVVRRLMTLEWSDTELMQHFQVSKRTVVDLRRVWREETSGGCADVARLTR